MKIRKLKLLLALFLCMALKSYAAPSPPRPQAIPPPVGDPAPIDSEIWILFASGLLLGLFFLFRNSKSTA